MAENLKLFFNGNKTSANITNTNIINVFTSNSTAKALVTDVYLSGLPLAATSNTTANSKIMVSNTELAGANTVSGRAFVDVNESLYIKLVPTPDPTPTLYYRKLFVGYNSGVANASIAVANGVVATTGNYFGANSALTTTGLTTSAVFTKTANNTGGTMTNPVWYYANKAKTMAFYFNYNGNETTTAYSSALTGGTAHNSWNSFSGGGGNYEYKAIDVDNEKIYWKSSATSLYTYDMATQAGTTTTSAFSSVNTSTYNHAAYVNGIFFSQPNNGETMVQWYNISGLTGTAASLGNIALGRTPGSNGGFAVSYNPTENKYFIMWFNAGTYYLYSVNADATMSGLTAIHTSVTGQATFQAAMTGAPFTPHNGRGYIFGDSFGYFWMMTSAGGISRVKVGATTLVAETISASNVWTADYNNCGIVVGVGDPIAGTVTNYPFVVNVRATGVEITPNA